MDAVADHLEGLEGDHDFVVLGEVADEMQNLFGHVWILLFRFDM